MGFGNLDLTLVILDQSSNSAPNAQKPTTQTLYQRLRVEKEGEEADVPFEGAAAAPDLSPKRGTEGCSARSQRSRSYGNGYGCTTFNDDEENTKDAEQGQDLNKQFEVRFEGVSDPMNPRSSGKTQLVSRFIDGFAGSAFLSVAGRTVGNVFVRNELQAPMMIFMVSPFIGPPVELIIAGFINQYTSWRWIFYVLINCREATEEDWRGEMESANRAYATRDPADYVTVLLLAIFAAYAGAHGPQYLLVLDDTVGNPLSLLLRF
ncbi:MAG: hypothetical protein Q9175_007013 [Cornicularia normoerica]